MELKRRKKSGDPGRMTAAADAGGKAPARNVADLPKRVILYLVILTAAVLLIKIAVIDPLISANEAKLAEMGRIRAERAAESAGEGSFFDVAETADGE